MTARGPVPVGWVVIEHPAKGLPGLVLPATLHPHREYAAEAAAKRRRRATETESGRRYSVAEVVVVEEPK